MSETQEGADLLLLGIPVKGEGALFVSFHGLLPLCVLLAKHEFIVYFICQGLPSFVALKFKKFKVSKL